MIDLVLSGDNAVVIGMAARTLEPVNRRKAILWGGAGAVALRIIFTIAAALLLDVQLIQAIGGLLLIWIAFRLVAPEGGAEGSNIRAAGSLGKAIQTIVLADVVMSLDNILAVGGAAGGHLELLIFGLALSIPILLFGSNLVARLLQNQPWLLILGVLVLVHSATAMVAHDRWVKENTQLAMPQWGILVTTVMLTGAVIGLTKLVRGGVAGIDEPAVHGST